MKEYLDHLRKQPKSIWIHKHSCCESMPPRTHLLKPDSLGFHCVIFKKNQAYYYNSLTHKPKTKSSGCSNPDVSYFLSKCISDDERAVCLEIDQLTQKFNNAPKNQTTVE